MSHKIPTTLLHSEGATHFIIHTDAGSVSVSGAVSILGAGICTTSATGISVFVTGTGANGSLTIHTPSGDASPIGQILNFTTPSVSQQFFSTFATGNTLYFVPDLIPVSAGGTGLEFLNINNLILGQGTNPVDFVRPGTDGQTLIGASGLKPLFSTITSTGNTLTFTQGPYSLNIEFNGIGNSFFSTLPVGRGGTGRTVLTSYGVLVGEGSLAVNVIPPGTDGQTLIGATGADPLFSTISSPGNTVFFTPGHNSLDIEVNLSAGSPLNPWPVEHGGTGDSGLSANTVLIGEGSLSVGTTNQGVDGQALIAATNGDPEFSTITSNAGSIQFVAEPNALNLDVSFSGLTFVVPFPVSFGSTGRSLLTTYGVLIGEGSLPVNVSPPGTNGQVFLGSSTGDPAFATITSTGGSLTFSFGHNSLNIEVNRNSTLFNPLQVSNGGTGRTVLTSYGVLIGEGSLPVNVTPPGTDGQALIASSIGDPAFSTITSTGGTLTFTFGHNSLNMDVNFGNTFFNPLIVSNGGTGLTLLTAYTVLIGEGSLGIHTSNVGTDGQAFIASTTGDPAFATISSTGNSIVFTAGHNSLNAEINWAGISLFNPLPVAKGSTGETSLTAFGVLIGEGSLGVHVTDAGTNGQILVGATGQDPAFTTIVSNNHTVDVTGGINSLNLDVGNATGLFLQANLGNAFPIAETLDIVGGNSISTTGSASTIIIQANLTTGSFFNPMPPGSGSTGLTLLTTHGVLIGEGTLAVHVTAAGTNGQTLLASTTGDPRFSTITSTGGSLTFTFGPRALNIDVNWNRVSFFAILQVDNGGTGRTIFTTFGVLLGEGSLDINTTPAGTNGQILIASSTGDPAFATLSSTGRSLSFTLAAHALNINVDWNAIINPLPTPNGGTGQSLLTTHGVLIGEGSLDVNVTAAGTNGQLLLASSTGDPKFSTITSTGGTLTFTVGVNSLNIEFNWRTLSFFNPLQVDNGGTGQTIFTTHGVLIGEGTLDVSTTNVGSNGQLLIASTTGDPRFSTITSTGGTLTFRSGINSLNMEFNWRAFSFFNPLQVGNGGTGRTLLTNHGVLIGEGSNDINVTAAGTNGQVLLASSIGDPKFSSITSTGGTLSFRFGANSLNVDVIVQGKTFFNPLIIQKGGTGRTVLTNHGVLIGEGSLKINVSAAGTNGQAFLAASTGDPRFSTITSTGGTLTFTFGSNALNIEINGNNTLFNPWTVNKGGTSNQSEQAYAVICGGTTSTSALQSVVPIGTSGLLLTSNGPGALPSFRGTGINQITVQTFTSSGTYTPSAGMLYCTVECVGAGGGSGGLTNASPANASRQGAGGGGGGGYAKKTFFSATVGASQAITIGAGGAGGSTSGGTGGTGGVSSFGALLTATGGSGGAGSFNTSGDITVYRGGIGGTGSLGDLNISGQNGYNGWATFITNTIFDESDLAVGGAGGCSHFGGGGNAGVLAVPQGTLTTIIIPGQNGQAIGGGAGAPVSQYTSAPPSGTSGAAGADGTVIITEYI